MKTSRHGVATSVLLTDEQRVYIRKYGPSLSKGVKIIIAEHKMLKDYLVRLGLKAPRGDEK